MHKHTELESNPATGEHQAKTGCLRRQPRWRFIAAVAVLAIGGFWLWPHGRKSAGQVATFAARRGPLEITVSEGGSVQAIESQEIKCEVRVGNQGTKILKLVEEGYLVTDDDVKTNKVLVELDSSELQNKIVQEESEFQQAEANLIDAQQAYQIQLSDNESAIKKAAKDARFARMDFDKYVGSAVAATMLELARLDHPPAAVAANSAAPPALQCSNPAPATVQANGVAQVAAGQNATNRPTPPLPDPAPEPVELAEAGLANPFSLDFSGYADIGKLGDGDARKSLRQYEDALKVAQKELEASKTKLEGTQRLFAREFTTRTEVQQDEINFEQKRLSVQTAESTRDLFLKYDFVKNAEDALFKYADAARELDKARRVAISKLAQARAKLNQAQSQHQIKRRQLDDLKDQLAKCTIHATKTGLVAYGSAGDDYRGDEPIREGAAVRERQVIITIPDMSRMSLKVRIPECYIKRIKKGQKARITVEAFPDKALSGEVSKVAVLADSTRWFNPDLKVYPTTINIEGTQSWLKPGMTAMARILVEELDDCIYVPMQAVSAEGERQVCYVAAATGPQRRPVELGEFNDEFIELKSGLREGERVLLCRPGGLESEKPAKDSKPAEKTKPPATTPASATAQARKT